MDEMPAGEDMLRVSRLIHELCELGGDTRVWRERMMAEMEKLVGAHASVSYLMRFSLDPADIAPKTLIYMERGMNEVWQAFMAGGDLSSNPVTVPIMQRFGTDWTVARNGLIDDDTWYASDFHRDIATPSHFDDVIYSQVAVNDPRVVDGLSLCRDIGDPRFTPKDVALVKFFHCELARLWNRQDPVGVHTLPTRQREVLDGIRRGESRKTIAQKMGISDHTVKSYEKSLFDRAGVTSRGELLARLSNLIRPNLLP